MSSVPLARRAGGPDLARGLALLGIALANTVGWLHGSQWTVLLKQVDATAVDRAVDVLIALTADNRGFPLFALLFGYGIGVLWRRSQASGEPLAGFFSRTGRRNLVLLVLGLAHATLLFTGDILRAYALLGLVLMLAVPKGRRVLVLTGALGSVGLLWYGWADGVSGLASQSVPPAAAAVVAPDFATSVADRLPQALWGTLTAPMIDIGLLAPMAIGALLATSRVLEDVAAHRDLLRRLAAWGVGIGLIGALPLALVLASDRLETALHHEVLLGSLGILHQVTGVVGAAGAAALAALLTARRSGDPAGWISTSLAALGRMSLTAYLLQSAGAAVVFSRWGTDLGSRLGTAGAAGICLLLWLGVLALAVLLASRRRRGPAEALLRRIVYAGENAV